MSNPAALRLLMKTVGVDRCLLGTEGPGIGSSADPTGSFHGRLQRGDRNVERGGSPEKFRGQSTRRVQAVEGM